MAELKMAVVGPCSRVSGKVQPGIPKRLPSCTWGNKKKDGTFRCTVCGETHPVKSYGAKEKKK